MVTIMEWKESSEISPNTKENMVTLLPQLSGRNAHKDDEAAAEPRQQTENEAESVCHTEHRDESQTGEIYIFFFLMKPLK